MHRTGKILTSKDAYARFESILQEHGMDISERQWQNWVGSSKVYSIIWSGRRRFDPEHINEVATRYVQSNGRAYSVYVFDKDTNKVIENLNSYQCAQLWNYSDRQTQNLIVSGKVRHLRIGHEYFVPKEEALRYQVELRSGASDQG